jgi:predicted nucleotidyltransferase
MIVTGVIAEFNPLHKGHALLLKKVKEAGADRIAVVMSGNFVQRGETAILSKWARTKQALLCGADLVVELPVPWAVSGAEKFALGGISLLDAVGADRIAFGSECGSIDLLRKAQQALSSPLLHEAIHDELAAGSTFAAARQTAVRQLFGEKTAQLLGCPNNILAIEYLKAMERTHSHMVPFTVQREGAAHDSKTPGENRTASSAQIRRMIQSNADCSEFLPSAAWTVLQSEREAGRAPASLVWLERGILAKLRTLSKDKLSRLPDISEGLENRVYSAIQRADSLGELYRMIKTKRYTLARIRRIVLSAFLGIDASCREGDPPYLRILGIRKGGADILKRAKISGNLPILSRKADCSRLDSRAAQIIKLENTASDLFALCTPRAAPCGLDASTGVIVL